jgi:hypothetical protein
MQESDTYLAILDEGQEKATRESILLLGEGRFGPPEVLKERGQDLCFCVILEVLSPFF